MNFITSDGMTIPACPREQSRVWDGRLHIIPKTWSNYWFKFQAIVASGEPGEMEAASAAFRRRISMVPDSRGSLSRPDRRNRQMVWQQHDIEDRKHAEEKLRRMSASFAALPMLLRKPFVVQSPNRLSRSLRIRRLLDYTGLTIEDVTTSDFRARIFHSLKISSGLREERQAALARGVPFEIEQRALRHDGQYRWFLIRYNPFRDEQGRLVRWYATGTDIEDRKRAEEKDQKRKRRVAAKEIDRSSMFEK